MSDVKKEIMAQKIKQYESAIFKYLFKVTENRNTFFYDMLNDFSVSIWFPILSCLIQYFHIFFFIFKENVRYSLLFILLYFFI